MNSSYTKSYIDCFSNISNFSTVHLSSHQKYIFITFCSTLQSYKNNNILVNYLVFCIMNWKKKVYKAFVFMSSFFNLHSCVLSTYFCFQILFLKSEFTYSCNNVIWFVIYQFSFKYALVVIRTWIYIIKNIQSKCFITSLQIYFFRIIVLM